MDLNKKICLKIKEIRTEKNINQLHIAKFLNMDRTTFNKIENGVTDITIPILEKISNCLEVSISDLLSIESTSINNVSDNTGHFSSQGINTTLNINIPSEFINELKRILNQ